MCLILFAIAEHPDYPLVLVANRDEFHDRPSAALDEWQQPPGIYAGRDLLAGGTWMGFCRSGRFAAVTNYRDGDAKTNRPNSRGQLCVDWLLGNFATDEFIRHTDSSNYAGFNMLLGHLPDHLVYFSSSEPAPQVLPPGVYGLSNGRLNDDWPKVRDGRQALARSVADGADLEELLGVMADRNRAADRELPDTGIGAERESLLSPRFIVGPRYGTRASTVLRVDDRGAVDVWERRFDAQGMKTGDTSRLLNLVSPAAVGEGLRPRD